MSRYSRQLLVRALLLEGLLLVVAVVWAWLADISWQTALTPTLNHCMTGIAAGLLLLLVNYAVIEYGSRYNSFFRTIKDLVEEDVLPLFRNIDLMTAIVIALISGFAEELLFRGVLQNQIGLWLSSIVFGLAHIWKKTAVLYGIYAAGIGLILGSFYKLSGSLWIPILAHMVNNFVTILYYIHYKLRPEWPVVEDKP